MATPEQQATLDALTDVAAALSQLNSIIIATGNGGAAWDNATPAQRTGTINLLARVARGTAVLLRGVKTPLGTSEVPDANP